MKKQSRFESCFLLFFLFFANALTAQTIVPLQQGKPTSIRGLSVVDDNVAWISGSKGYVAITRDGGKNWDWQQVKGFEKADFRDIEAFSDKEAVIMSSGTPALILKTIDGGTNWKVKYQNADTSYFFDAMDFFNQKEGWILGDPINGKFNLMLSIDGGETWAAYDHPPAAAKDEAAFAASGTCLRTIKHDLLIVSGGSASNAFISTQRNKLWAISPVAVLKGKASQGAFSIAKDKSRLVVVGGDYEKDKRQDSTACYSTDNGARWQLATTPPAGFQSCVEYVSGDTFLSTGTPGSNITTDGGKTWTKIDATSYNVCRKAKHGKLVLLAGNGGKIGILKP